MCTALSIHLATWYAKSLFTELSDTSQGSMRKALLSEAIDRTFSLRLCFLFVVLFLFFFPPAGCSRIVQLWLAVAADEPVGLSVKSLGSLLRVATLLSSGDTGLRFVSDSALRQQHLSDCLADVCSCWEVSPVSEMEVSASSSIRVPCNLFMLRWGKICILPPWFFVPKFL